MTYHRPYIALCIISLAALACGTLPAALVESTSTPSATATEIARQATATVRHVTGCWNLRQTPAGVADGSICNADVIVLSVSNDWAQTADGWICRRAFGDAAGCIVYNPLKQ